MRSAPLRDPQFEDALARITELPPNAALDVLLHFFLGILNRTDLHTAHHMRDELVNHFGGRHCSGQVCRLMAELVNGHLADKRSPVKP